MLFHAVMFFMLTCSYFLTFKGEPNQRSITGSINTDRNGKKHRRNTHSSFSLDNSTCLLKINNWKLWQYDHESCHLCPVRSLYEWHHRLHWYVWGKYQIHHEPLITSEPTWLYSQELRSEAKNKQKILLLDKQRRNVWGKYQIRHEPAFFCSSVINREPTGLHP